MNNFYIDGQPKEVIFCNTCVYSNQKVVPSALTADKSDHSNRSFLRFNDNGTCKSCELIQRKNNTSSSENIDWMERENELRSILDKYRSRNGSFDCIVPGSGGKDSVLQAQVLREKYKMNPLTVTFSPIRYTEIGMLNFHKWPENGNVNNFLFSPNGETYGKLTRLAFETMLHPFQPFIFGQRHYATHMALKFKIPLIFVGEPHSEFGSDEDEEDLPYMLDRYFTREKNQEIFVSGVPESELIKKHNIPKSDLEYFLPLEREVIRKNDIQQYYFGYFEKMLPQENFYNAVKTTGFKVSPERTEGTYSTYNSLDDKVDGFHYWTQYIKFGIGRTTEEAANECRHSYITRDEAVNLVHKYDGEFPKRYFEEFLSLTKLNEEEFYDIIDSFRPDHLWQKLGNDFKHAANWKLKKQLK